MRGESPDGTARRPGRLDPVLEGHRGLGPKRWGGENDKRRDQRHDVLAFHKRFLLSYSAPVTEIPRLLGTTPS